MKLNRIRDGGGMEAGKRGREGEGRKTRETHDLCS